MTEVRFHVARVIEISETTKTVTLTTTQPSSDEPPAEISGSIELTVINPDALDVQPGHEITITIPPASQAPDDEPTEPPPGESASQAPDDEPTEPPPGESGTTLSAPAGDAP